MTQPTMQIVCGWCGKLLGTKPCSPSQAGQVTHGICPACAAQMLRDAAAKAVRK
jgi:hypothetical protein